MSIYVPRQLSHWPTVAHGPSSVTMVRTLSPDCGTPQEFRMHEAFMWLCIIDQKVNASTGVTTVIMIMVRCMWKKVQQNCGILNYIKSSVINLANLRFSHSDSSQCPKLLEFLHM